ncbi:hypothetical protein PENSPDRAFT_747114 [Peniophora sp. CONT]|nr:hypothetical protein PENSPDRAFT_747114 [Peniophora sp. CONT]
MDWAAYVLTGYMQCFNIFSNLLMHRLAMLRALKHDGLAFWRFILAPPSSASAPYRLLSSVIGITGTIMYILAIFFHHFCKCLLSALLFRRLAAARTSSIPPAWAGTTSNFSREMRAGLAFDAATAILNRVDPTSGVTPGAIPEVQHLSSLFAVLAIQDYYSGNTTWVDTLTKVMPEYISKHGLYNDPNAGWSGDANYWALAFYYAYRTYGQGSLLNTAIEIYNTTYAASFITSTAAANGTGVDRSVSFDVPSTCPAGTSFAGGVFRSNGAVASVIDVCAECVGPFLTLSAYLFEETNQTLYQDAAQLSVDFMINNMWNGTIVCDTFHLHDCSSTPKPLTLNQAGFVEGLSVWANVTNNGTLTTLLEDVISGVTTFSEWSSTSGIITEHSDPLDISWEYNLKGLFIRALSEARARNPDSDLAKYIEAYITVQFNSLLSNAQGSAPNNNFYATSWTDQRASTFSAIGNIAAMDVLNAASSLVLPTTSGPSSSPTPSSSPSSGPTPSSNSERSKDAPLNTGAVAGGVVGGAIVIFASAFLLWRRRRKHRRRGSRSNSTPSGFNSDGMFGYGVVEPYFQSSPARQWSKAHGFDVSSRDDERQGDREQQVTAASEQVDTTGMQEVAQPADPSGLDDVPSLVGRLYNLLHGTQGELPPAYGN